MQCLTTRTMRTKHIFLQLKIEKTKLYRIIIQYWNQINIKYKKNKKYYMYRCLIINLPKETSLHYFVPRISFNSWMVVRKMCSKFKLVYSLLDMLINTNRCALQNAIISSNKNNISFERWYNAQKTSQNINIYLNSS